MSDLTDTFAVDFLFLAKNAGNPALFTARTGSPPRVGLLTTEVKIETGTVVSAVEESAGGVPIHRSSGGGPPRELDPEASVLAAGGGADPLADG